MAYGKNWSFQWEKGCLFHFRNQLMKFRLGSLISGIRVKKWCWQVSPAACWNLANCKGSCKTGCPKSLRKLLSNIIENNLLALSKTRLLIGKLQNAHSFDLLHAGTFLDRASRCLLSPELSARFQTFKLGIFHQRNSRIAELRRWHVDTHPPPKPGEHPLGSSSPVQAAPGGHQQQEGLWAWLVSPGTFLISTSKTKSPI